MTNEKAIRILTRLQICADTDACDADCEACQFNDDNDEIHEAIDVAIQVLKGTAGNSDEKDMIASNEKA